MSAREEIRPALPMPIRATPYRHQIEAFNFVCGLFGLLPGGDWDGDKRNNAPLNLEVLPSQSSHCKAHSFGKKEGGDADEHFQ